MTDPKPALSTSEQEIAQPQLDILSDAELEMMKTETERHYSEPWPFTHPRQVSMPITQLLKLIRRAHSPAVQALESQRYVAEHELIDAIERFSTDGNSPHVILRQIDAAIAEYRAESKAKAQEE